MHAGLGGALIAIIPHVIVVPDMKLSPNVGSDRSWVWNTAMDVSENPTGEPQTLAIRFANSESMFFNLSPSLLFAPLLI